MPLPCSTALQLIQGTNFNTVEVPGGPGSYYKDNTDKLLYEIWQTLLLIQAANPPTVTKVISFTIGDGQAGTPINGTNSLEVPALQGQSLVNVNLLVVREGVPLRYTNANGVLTYDIRRYNHAGNGGFVFEPASAQGGGLQFVTGEHYDLYVVGANTADQI